MNKRHPNFDRYQRGAETVEFMITLLLFMLIFIMIIEFAILTYDRGAVNNSVRMGSRQATLYWVDPALFDPLTPLANRRLKPQMVQSVIDWTEQNVLIDASNVGLNPSLQLNATAIDLTSTTPVVMASAVANNVTFDVGYAHQYLALTGLSGATGPNMNTLFSTGVE